MTLVISYDIDTTAAKTCLHSISKIELELITSHYYECPLIDLLNGGAEKKFQRTHKWLDIRQTLCKMFNVNMEYLPDVIQSTDLIGNLIPKATSDLDLSEKTKIFGGDID